MLTQNADINVLVKNTNTGAKQQTLGNTDFGSIAISGLAKGIYTVKVVSGDKMEAQQVVVE